MSRRRIQNADGTWSCNVCGKDKPGEQFYCQPATGKPKAACKDCQRRKLNESRTKRRTNPNAYQSLAKEPPTPEEIAAATAAIQADWTEKERYRRAGLNPDSVAVYTQVVSGSYSVGRCGHTAFPWTGEELL